MIDDNSVAYIKENSDIVDVIGDYLPLKKAGVNYSACCPFHDEKTPSFIVSRAKGIFHCYGCGKGGDVITFLRELKQLSYAEALEELASILGYTPTYTKSSQKSVNYHEFLANLASFYEGELRGDASILSYLHDRGVSDASIARFKVGYSASGFKTLRFIDESATSRQEALATGVLVDDRGSFYARFANRVMFPIANASGKVVGFGGRSLDLNARAKYLNSNESPIFKKGSLLYGYHLAKPAIYRQKNIIVTEGYLDVIMLHQAGFVTSVATLGTALTTNHLPLLNKEDIEVILAYDGDDAGRAAAFKASTLLASSGINGAVVLFPQGLDPADMVKEGRIDELRGLFKGRLGIIEFVLQEIVARYDLNNVDKKEGALKEVNLFLAKLSAFKQTSYKPLAAKLLNIRENLLLSQRLAFKKRGKEDFSFMSALVLSEAMILRYMLEVDECYKLGVSLLDKGMFQNLGGLYVALLKGRREELNAIALSPTIVFPPLELRAEFEEEARAHLMDFGSLGASGQQSIESKTHSTSTSDFGASGQQSIESKMDSTGTSDLDNIKGIRDGRLGAMPPLSLAAQKRLLDCFKEELRGFILRAYQRDLATLSHMSLPPLLSLAKKRAINSAILKLTQGDLIRYEGISTI